MEIRPKSEPKSDDRSVANCDQCSGSLKFCDYIEIGNLRPPMSEKQIENTDRYAYVGRLHSEHCPNCDEDALARGGFLESQ